MSRHDALLSCCVIGSLTILGAIALQPSFAWGQFQTCQQRCRGTTCVLDDFENCLEFANAQGLGLVSFEGSLTATSLVDEGTNHFRIVDSCTVECEPWPPLQAIQHATGCSDENNTGTWFDVDLRVCREIT